MMVVCPRQAVASEGVLDPGFDPGAQFEVFLLLACEPGGAVGARFGGIAAVVEPAERLPAGEGGR